MPQSQCRRRGSVRGEGVAAMADAARATLADDTANLKQISGSKGLFIPGSGHVSQVTRIA